MTISKISAFLMLALPVVACGGEPQAVAPEPEKTLAERAATARIVMAPEAEVPVETAPKIYDYEVVATYPHNAGDFTQGLFFADGVLYESTGKYGNSALIRHDLFGDAEGARVALPQQVFGEGSVAFGDRIISVTWREGTGYVFDRDTMQQTGTFDYAGEGWGLTTDGRRLILSDGSNRLRFLDPDTFEETGSVAVQSGGKPVPRLNELEYVDGEVWANIWMMDIIARIDPDTGNVTGFIDMSGLNPQRGDPRDEVLNGIAYDETSGRLIVTGKLWPTLYEVRIVPRG